MPCSHLQTVMNKGHEALDAYKTIHANLITPWTNAGLERKAKASQCFMPLSNHSMPMDAYKKLHACLHCIHVACQAHRYDFAYSDVNLKTTFFEFYFI